MKEVTEEHLLHDEEGFDSFGEYVDYYANVAHAVGEYIESNGVKYVEGILNMGHDEIEHIARIGTSIMMNHWNLNRYEPGSFVKAVVEGDLDGAFVRADHINTKAIRLYVMMKHNLSYPF